MSYENKRTRPVLRKRFDEEMQLEVETFTAPDTPFDDPLYAAEAEKLRDSARARMLDAWNSGYLNEELPEAEQKETGDR